MSWRTPTDVGGIGQVLRKGMSLRGLVVTADWDPKPGYTASDDEIRCRRAVDGSSVWRHPQVGVQELHDPRISQPDEMIIRSRAVGICGSDVHMCETDEDGYILLPYRTRFPVVIGHEFCAEVLEIGNAVTRFKVGDPVAVEAMRYCGACPPCRVGLSNFCTNCEDHGFTLDGGCAEYVVVRERSCWSLTGLADRFNTDDMFRVGALIEPTSIAYNGIFTRAGGPNPGSTAAVFGCGPVGLACIHLLRAAGAGQLIAFDTLADRRTLALTMGADLAFDPTDPNAERAGRVILDQTGGRGAQFFVEASGASNAVFPEIETALAYGAKVVVIGLDSRPTAVNLMPFQATGSRIFGTLGHLEGAFGATIAMHETGRIDMTPVVSREFPLEQAELALIQQGRRSEGKILIRP